ncbi:MAG: ABC transporter permease [Erysipelotrichaceae bacterium]|nr:ABC transporter permease [Erysipelotrichaceae bacterium]
MRLAETKKRFSLPFHVVKRLDTPKKQYWLIKIAGFLAAFLLAGLICTIFRPGSFGTFYKEMFLGVFDPSDLEILFEFLETVGLLLLVAFALAPAFKMRFWNIGGEGQILVGCLVTAAISKFMAGTSDALVIILCLVLSILAGIIWAVIPAIFKAFFNTNETLFTLMMNYVAMALIALLINVWVPSGTQVFGRLTNASLPSIFGIKYLFNIIVVVIVVTLMIVYLKKTKHGYELAVVGESVNTARYVGINVKKVIIRTMILSGAICGLVGFLLVAGHHHTLSTGLADGRGFTGVLIAWLGGFQPGQMILYSFLVGIFQCGSRHAASYMAMNSTDFSAIVTGMFFLVVIASEFFVNYKIMKKDKEVHNNQEIAFVNANNTTNNMEINEVKEEKLEEIESPLIEETKETDSEKKEAK